MPYKEWLLDRSNSTITIPSSYWLANTTIPIEKAIFVRSAPHTSGIGSYMLQMPSPNPKAIYFFNSSFGNSCYEDLSFILWYMDKNRPLPPGTAFDPYRERDFKRRKAEGFPKPLFPADFDTPEATPEQQAERERIGGW